MNEDIDYSNIIYSNFNWLPISLEENDNNIINSSKVILPENVFKKHLNQTQNINNSPAIYSIRKIIDDTNEEEVLMNKIVYCGVIKYIEENMVYLPNQIANELCLQQEDKIIVESITLPKGTFAKLKPLDEKLIDLLIEGWDDAFKDQLQKRNDCLTEDTTISINLFDEEFNFDVISLKPSISISLFETDLELEFDMEYVNNKYNQKIYKQKEIEENLIKKYNEEINKQKLKNKSNNKNTNNYNINNNILKENINNESIDEENNNFKKVILKDSKKRKKNNNNESITDKNDLKINNNLGKIPQNNIINVNKEDEEVDNFIPFNTTGNILGSEEINNKSNKNIEEDIRNRRNKFLDKLENKNN